MWRDAPVKCVTTAIEILVIPMPKMAAYLRPYRGCFTRATFSAIIASPAIRDSRSRTEMWYYMAAIQINGGPCNTYRDLGHQSEALFVSASPLCLNEGSGGPLVYDIDIP